MKRDISIALIAILIVFGVAFALTKLVKQPPLSPSSPFVAETHATGSGASKKIAANDKIVMRVNGEPITEREFATFMTAVPEQQRAMFASPEGRKLLAQEIVRMKALEQEGERLGVAKDAELTAQFELLHTQLIAQRTAQKLVEAKAEPKIKAEYERTKNEVKTLRHIVIGYEGSMVPPRDRKPLSPEAAMAKANALAQKIRGGADFAQIAMTESDDLETARKGGSLGALSPNQQLPPEVEAAIANLKPGQVSNPVRTQLGLHLFSIGTPTLEELRPALLQRVQQEILQEEVQRLEKAAKVEYEPWYFPPSPQETQPRGVSPAPRSNG